MAHGVSRRGIGWVLPVSGAILFVSAIFLWMVWRPPATEAAPEVLTSGPPLTAAHVEAMRVRRADFSLRAEATGYLEPWRKVEIGAEISGRVIERSVEEGSEVASGALLFRLDDRDHQIELEEAQAEWLKIQAGYAVDFGGADAKSGREQVSRSPDSNGEVRRAEQLLREGLISKYDLNEIRRRSEAARILSGSHRGEVRAASSGLAQAEQRVERARLALERTRILAPFAGRVADLAVEVGQQVSSGERLLTLLEDDRIKVDVDVLESDMPDIRRSAPARVRIPSLDNLTLEGLVHTINPRVEPETGTGRITVAISNRRRLLLAGLFTSVELETRRLASRLVIPSSALLARQGRSLVFRLEDGRALWTYVQVGERSGNLVEVTEGLSEGDLVATSGHFSLAHEAPVEVRIVDNPSTASTQRAAGGSEPWNP